MGVQHLTCLLLLIQMLQSLASCWTSVPSGGADMSAVNNDIDTPVLECDTSNQNVQVFTEDLDELRSWKKAISCSSQSALLYLVIVFILAVKKFLNLF